MDVLMDRDAQDRLSSYLEQVGSLLGHVARRASFAMYVYGLFCVVGRKTMEGIAAQACTEPGRVGAVHQKIQHFITDSTWEDHPIRRHAGRYAVTAMTQEDDIEAWIIDDTGFLKNGPHSVGVQRQYTGSAGKITQCQIGTSLTLATSTTQVPVDFQLYIPESWASNPDRRKEAGIPDDIQFQTKPEQALGMVEQALADGYPKGVVLADEAYGNSSAFREGIRNLELDYAVAISASTKVWLVEPDGTLSKENPSVSELAKQLQATKRFRRYTWREGTSRSLSAHFAFRRVIPYHDDGRKPDEREHLWLICEWRDGESNPEHFHLSSVRRSTRRKTLIRLIKQRWRTERVYQDLKGELGLDHFEGRRFRGWNHHVSVALTCYAFLIAERARRFSPSAAWTSHPHTLSFAA